MSNYSRALQQTIDNHFNGTQSRLAEKCDISQPLISRHLTGEFRPDFETLEKICSALTPEIRTPLACAHLHDETPPSARYFISIQPLIDGAPSTIDERPSAISRLDEKTRRALEFIANVIADDEEGRDYIQSTARFLGADLSTDEIEHTEKPRKKVRRSSKPVRYKL